LPSSSATTLSRNYGIDCYHVNARLSVNLEDIGAVRPDKLFLIFGYCLQAIWCRFRYGVTNFYYIPAPGKNVALYRDWLVMFFCRPFFKRIIFHWHAAGMSKWLETGVKIRTRTITYNLMKEANLSIVLSKYNRADAEKLCPQQIEVVSNGIPDPCPDFETSVLPRRLCRAEARKKLSFAQPLTAIDLENTGGDPDVICVLYLAHYTREKGLFDTVAGVMRANEKLAASQSPLSLRLIVAGAFVRQDEKEEFENILASSSGKTTVSYIGFVSGEQKQVALEKADVFCFPTYYTNENQPVNMIEAMAFGLPLVTTRWRSVHEMLPAGYPGVVAPKSPEEIADALLDLMTRNFERTFRSHFLDHYTVERHLANLATALHRLE
jgi:glycosyltransferase involved in cell wall biosynthesis